MRPEPTLSVAPEIGPALALLVLAACTNPVRIGADYSHVYPDGGARIRCGPVDCSPGEYCCNQACGLCAALGACPPVSTTCGDASGPCGPDDVSLTGSASCTWFVWNGVGCVEVLGCSCSGSCGLPQASYIACMELHSACWSRTCSTASLCPAGYFCERPTCNAAVTGACRAVPSDCSSATHGAICGCDQIEYTSSCEAARARQSVIADAPACGVCNAPAVTITPGCTTSIGWSWDGSHCIERVGCACDGDCARLEPSEMTCIARYQSACQGMFPCGPRSCRRGVEVCNSTTTGAYCAAPSATACATPTCTCLVAAGATTLDACTDDGAGAVVVTVP